MYRRKDDLAQLIQSLASNEKSHLTRVFKQSEENFKYVDLYHQIEKSKSRTINSDLQLSVKSLIDQKHLLYKRILKHLKQMNHKSSHELAIQNLLAEVEILYNHSLADQAMRLLQKAYKIANAFEKYGLLLQILNWEQKISIVVDHPLRSIEAIRSEEEDILLKTAQINLLMGFYSQIMLLKKEHGNAKGTIRDKLELLIIKHPSFPTAQSCKSNKAIYYYNLIFSIYHWMVFEHDLSYRYSKSLLNADNQNILPADYINGLFQHITSCVCLTRFKDALSGIRVAQAFMEEHKLNQSNAFNQRFFSYNVTYKLIIYSYMGKRNQLTEVIQEAEQQLELWSNVIPLELRQVIYGNIMNAYIAIGDAEKAMDNWTNLFNRESTQIRKDIYADLFLIRVFFQLQSGTYSLLPTTTAAALRFYRKTEENRSKFNIELSLVQLFALDIDFANAKILKTQLHHARLLLENYISELSGGFGFQEHYTRYLIWLEAIEKEIPYYRAARDWYKQQEIHS